MEISRNSCSCFLHNFHLLVMKSERSVGQILVLSEIAKFLEADLWPGITSVCPLYGQSFRQQFLLVVSVVLKQNQVLALTGIRVLAYSYVMRYSREHKAHNHEKILSVAARSFRERGGDSSGIGTVMKKVGLKKGGFYRHFKSKDDLFVEAVARALDETGRDMVEVAKSAPEGQALRAIIERYLSAGHANSPGTGCVRAALGPELARKPVAVRRRIESLLEAYRERFLPFMPGQTRVEKQAKIRLLFPSMAGVLMMARVSSDPQRREQMLMDARNFFIKSFAEQ
jgi:TetR/AcrR family transcriptional repressor of nem operon